MTQETHIQKISRYLELICLVFILLCSAGLLWYLFQVDRGGLWMAVRNPFFLEQQYQPLLFRLPGHGGALLRLLMLNVLKGTLLVYGLWRLSKMFALYRELQLFTEQSATHLLVFSVCNLLVVFLGSFENYIVFANLYLTGSNFVTDPSGSLVWLTVRSLLQFAMDSVIPLSFLMISWVIRAGVALRTENEGFV